MKNNKQLYLSWCKLRIKQPHLQLPDYACLLETSPAQLLISGLTKETTLLRSDWANLLPSFTNLIEVVAMTDNGSSTIACRGSYQKVNIAAPARAGMVLSKSIDLRFTFSNWYLAIAFNDKFKQQQSFEFFNHSGDLIHSVKLTDSSDFICWDNLVNLYKIEDPEPINFNKTTETRQLSVDENIDAMQLRQFWQELTDTHHFYRLLNKFNVSRLQALRLVQPPWAQQQKIDYLTKLLEQAAQDKIALMIFVMNDACMQIYTGFIKNTIWRQNIFCILDEKFNLLIKTAQIATAWLVRKHCKTGWVTSWEVYDINNQLVLQIYGTRKSSEPEQENWRQLAESFSPNTRPQ